jgi:hypothetical protein
MLEDRCLLSTNWVDQGPGPILGNGLTEGMPGSPVAGGVQALAVDPTNPDVVYAGANGGGVWKTTNATAASPTWTPLTDLQLPALSINSLAISPAHPDTVFAGTGSMSSFYQDGSPGFGLARSTDGGATWKVLAADTFAGQNIRSVVPTTLDHGKVVLVATEFRNIPYLQFSDGGGVYRSTDNGASFARISGAGGTGLPDQAVSDLVADPSDPNRFYAAVPTPFNAAPTGREGIYRSDDGGLTWAPVNTGLTGLDDAGRILLSVHNSPGHDVVYAAILVISGSPNGGGVGEDVAGVFRSTDQGGDWSSMGVPALDVFQERQGLFNGAIAADPHDPNVVFLSGDGDFTRPGLIDVGDVFRGDASLANPWSPVYSEGANGTAPHPDSCALVFDSNGSLLEATDGGIYRLVYPGVDATRHWVSVNSNLRTAELHSVAYDPVSNVVLGGAHENGNAAQEAPGQLAWNDFQNQGDGGVVAVDSDQSAHPGTSIRYSSYQFLDSFTRQSVDANNVAGPAVPVGLHIVAGDGAGQNLLDYDPDIRFMQPFVLNAVDPSRMLIGTTNLYESFDRGDSLTDLGFTGSFVGGNDFFGLPFGRFMAYGGRLNGVAYPDVIYASSGASPILGGHGAQLLHRVHLGDPLTPLSAYPGLGVAAVVVDPQDYRRIYVADASNRVFASFDEGVTWTDLTVNLPKLTSGNVGRTIEIYSTSPSDKEDVLMVGNLGGVFAMTHPDGPGAHWNRLGDGLPHALTLDLHYDYTDNVLVAGTLGRGAWTLTNPFDTGDSSAPDTASAAPGDRALASRAADAAAGTPANVVIPGAALPHGLLGLIGGDAFVVAADAARWDGSARPMPGKGLEVPTPGNLGEEAGRDLSAGGDPETGQVVRYARPTEDMPEASLAARGRRRSASGLPVGLRDVGWLAPANGVQEMSADANER